MSRYCSIILCAAVLALVSLGLVMLTSTGAWVKAMSDPDYFRNHQAIAVAVGLVAAAVAAGTSVEWMRRCSLWFYAVIVVLLVLCYVPGVQIVNYGSKRWIPFPGLGQFQPSELAKVVVVMCLAAWYARWQTEVQTFWRGFVLPGIVALVPIALIAGETDVGSALSLSATVGILMIGIGTRLRYLIPTAALGLSGAIWFVMHDANRWARIEAWLDLENPVHQLDRGMQQWRALLALGNGGPWGVGLGNGIEKFGTLTFAHIDFIFPVIGEELGLPFTLGVVACYVLITLAGCGIAMQANTIYSRCIALGITALIVVPAMQNIAVTTAVLPNDGLPLPFVSYGGSSMIISLAAVGMLVGIHRQSRVSSKSEFPMKRNTRLALRL